MAFRTVELTEEELQQSGKRYEKFDAVGDRHRGVLVRIVSQTKTFNAAEGPKTFDAYIFYGPKRGDAKAPLMFEISPLPTNLEQKMKKALRPVSEGGFGLAPGKGHFMDMNFTGTRAIEGQANPMKIINLDVDTEFKPQKPLPAEVVWAQGKTPPASSGSGASARPPPDDDIPF
jgi:hypothetical protein